MHFDEFISALDSDLVGLELQTDLLPLIYERAGANAIAVDRVACGEKVCAMRVYGQSKEALDAYITSLTDVSKGRVLSRNWEDRTTSPDWIERRLIFATDQSVNGFLFENSGG